MRDFKKRFFSEKTIRLLLRRKFGGKEEFLLVHEKERDKPAGWGLPGGGLREYEGDIFSQIKKLLPVEVRLPDGKDGYRVMDNAEYQSYLEMIQSFPKEMPALEPRIVLLAVKEGMEETGFLAKPVKELYRKPSNNGTGHEVILLDCEIITGRLSKRCSEIDDADWFAVDNLPEGDLPEGMYSGHYSLLLKGIEAIQQIEGEKKGVTSE